MAMAKGGIIPVVNQMTTSADDMLTFVASLPPIQSAVKVDGMGDGARIQLDVPRSDIDAVLTLAREFGGRTFRVVVVDE